MTDDEVYTGAGGERYTVEYEKGSLLVLDLFEQDKLALFDTLEDHVVTRWRYGIVRIGPQFEEKRDRDDQLKEAKDFMDRWHESRYEESMTVGRRSR